MLTCGALVSTWTTSCGSARGYHRCSRCATPTGTCSTSWSRSGGSSAAVAGSRRQRGRALDGSEGAQLLRGLALHPRAEPRCPAEHATGQAERHGRPGMEVEGILLRADVSLVELEGGAHPVG